MGKIYSSAAWVIIWLSPEQKTDQFAIDMIKQRLFPVKVEDCVLLLRVLKRICLRPWFDRVWVAQELALAKRSPILQFGPRTIQWDEFYANLRALEVEGALREEARD